MIYFYQILMIVFIIFSARQQGMTHAGNKMLDKDEQKKWHFDGLATYCIMCAAMVYSCYWLVIPAFIIRVALFDPIYSKRAGLKPAYIGDGKQFSERLAIKLFGVNGGIKKAIVFLILSFALNVLNYYFFKLKI